jgi:hypothetical protein
MTEIAENNTEKFICAGYEMQIKFSTSKLPIHAKLHLLMLG